MVKADFKNTLIVLPIYNSELQLEELFRRLSAVSDGMDVLCVNDGSSDNSLDMIEKYKLNHIDLEENRGKGFALKIGLAYAKINGYKFVITIDSDLQHEPACIPNFLKTQNKENADLVIGFRDFNPFWISSQTCKNKIHRLWKKGESEENSGTMPPMRILSNSITSFIVSSITKRNILDSQSGYRLYNLELFDEEQIETDRYQMETEILLNYIRKNAVVAHVEIPIIYNDEKSYISHFRDIVNFVKVIADDFLGLRK